MRERAGIQKAVLSHLKNKLVDANRHGAHKHTFELLIIRVVLCCAYIHNTPLQVWWRGRARGEGEGGAR